jgi:hypothetical protein
LAARPNLKRREPATPGSPLSATNCHKKGAAQSGQPFPKGGENGRYAPKKSEVSAGCEVTLLKKNLLQKQPGQAGECEHRGTCRWPKSRASALPAKSVAIPYTAVGGSGAQARQLIT